MEIPDNLLCLFSAEVEEQHDSYVIEIPKHEITNGEIQSGESYRTAILSNSTNTKTANTKTDTSTKEHVSASKASEADETEPTGRQENSGPPVAEGEIREVDIDDIGEQGDGITRVERGFVVIVPETEKGERVTVEITDVQPNVAFGKVKERQTHF
jgi:predicted RNA-binding protein with TRAM domain